MASLCQKYLFSENALFIVRQLIPTNGCPVGRVESQVEDMTKFINYIAVLEVTNVVDFFANYNVSEYHSFIQGYFGRRNPWL